MSSIDAQPRDRSLSGIRESGALSAGAVELSILMPALNEAETIEVCIDKAQSFLTRSGVVGEVLVADNGSTDGTRAMAAAKNARVVPVSERGYGAALRGGIAAARGRYVIMGDADDSYDFARLDDFLARLREGRDLVMGNRFKGGIADGAMPFLHRYLGNPVLSFIGRLLFGTNIGDFHCGLRGFNRERIAALNLHTSGMEFASEMIISSALNGYSIAEVPTVLKKDGRSRPPHLRTWRDGWRHLRFLLMLSPRWLFIYPGMAFVFIGLVIDALLFGGPLAVARGVALDIHTLIVASMAILVGVQCISIGLVARRFASRYGLLPATERDNMLHSRLTLENLLVFSGVVILVSLIGVFWSVATWASVNFGQLNYPLVARVLVVSSTGIACGIQLAFLAFLASIIDLPIAQDRIPSAIG